jgi:hypothetical protein
MIFNYRNPNNLELLVDVAQTLHVAYVILFFIFLATSLNKKLSAKLGNKSSLLPQLILFVGIGAIINGVAVTAIANLR